MSHQSESEIVVGLDIGTTKVCAVVGEVDADCPAGEAILEATCNKGRILLYGTPGHLKRVARLFAISTNEAPQAQSRMPSQNTVKVTCERDQTIIAGVNHAEIASKRRAY